MTDAADLLAPDPPPPDPARRAELLALTTRRLADRRFKPGRALVPLATLAAGVALGWQLRPTPEVRVERVEVPVEVRVEVPVSTPGPVAVAAPEPPTPERVELAAELADDRAEAARLYRAAGDLFLESRRDYAQAARCYRISLAAAPPADRRVGAGDTWLMAQMKVSLNREVQ